jgi:hypothetical protein
VAARSTRYPTRLARSGRWMRPPRLTRSSCRERGPGRRSCGPRTRHAANTAALAALLDAETDNAGQITCGDGYWLGDFVGVMDQNTKRARRVRNVRTYVAHEMLAA